MILQNAKMLITVVKFVVNNQLLKLGTDIAATFLVKTGAGIEGEWTIN
jgi:hypothetical protein